jgi:NADH-quinone oxidoreductase subunit J
MNLGDIIYHVLFYGTALMVISSALIVAFGKNIVRAAFALLLTFFGIAGLYIFMAADFMAVLQILIYVGGILVLILFAVMLTNKIQDVKLSNPVTKPFVAAPLCLIVLIGLIWIIIKSPWQTKALIIAPTTAEIGKSLMGYYLLPFEAVSVVLLVALIGAAYLARPVRGDKTSAELSRSQKENK